MADWVTISSLATAGGTLVLAAATFASVRSANRSARASEQALLAGLRPLLVSSSLEDPPLKVSFQDGKWLRVEGGRVSAEAAGDVVYLAASLRNIGSGVAILHGWRILPGPSVSAPEHDLDTFHRLSRDLYIAPGDIGFWQGAFRDPHGVRLRAGPGERARPRANDARRAVRRLRGRPAGRHPDRARSPG